MEYVTKKGEVILMDEEDFKKFSDINWRVYEDGYVVGYKGRAVRLHREILKAPSGQRVDHVNGNRLDNRRENLRFCTAQENSRNKKPYLDREYKGVFIYEGSANHRVVVDGKHIGYYSDREAAANCYNYYAKMSHGEFARLNTVKIKMDRAEWESFKKQKKTKYKGVELLPKGRFRARIRVDNKTIHIGCYMTQEGAAEAYDNYVTQNQLQRKTNFAKARAAGITDL